MGQRGVERGDRIRSWKQTTIYSLDLRLLLFLSLYKAMIEPISPFLGPIRAGLFLILTQLLPLLFQLLEQSIQIFGKSLQDSLSHLKEEK